jgi:hypothetical protein
VEVQIDSDPSGSAVSVDDSASECTTPCTLELAAGRHVMKVTRPGYRDSLRIFNAPQESEHMVRLEPMMGKLAIKSAPPDAQIIINGQKSKYGTRSYGRLM